MTTLRPTGLNSFLSNLSSLSLWSCLFACFAPKLPCFPAMSPTWHFSGWAGSQTNSSLTPVGFRCAPVAAQSPPPPTALIWTCHLNPLGPGLLAAERFITSVNILVLPSFWEANFTSPVIPFFPLKVAVAERSHPLVVTSHLVLLSPRFSIDSAWVRSHETATKTKHSKVRKYMVCWVRYVGFIRARLIMWSDSWPWICRVRFTKRRKPFALSTVRAQFLNSRSLLWFITIYLLIRSRVG